jgi:oligoribonuclease NrnB/cAMP/cGMP phosphodiesterase (DHH superfamily)
MPWKPDIMIYHANCADGFGAAWAAWSCWGNEVQYIPSGYGQAAPDLAGKHVLIGDFSYKRDTIDLMAQSAASIVILDHHKTAQEDLGPFIVEDAAPSYASVDHWLRDLAEMGRPPVAALFDMSRSGARMVWEFCFPHSPIPMLIELVEDRDLWLFRLPETKPFALWLRAEPFAFDRWEEIAQQLNDARDHDAIMAEARGMQRFYDQKVSEMVGFARYEMIGGVSVPVVNCASSFASDVGNALLIAHPTAEFAACYCDTRKGRQYSLRSDDTRRDVSAIAKRYGGGGHRNAAGFEVPRL